MMESMDFHKIMAFIYLPTILIGLFGNILSLYAYSRPNRKSMVGFLLYSLSISDIFMLVFALPLFSIMYLPIWSDEQKSFVVAYTAKYVYPLCMMAKTCSLYIMVLITIERWIAVCRPLEVQIWCRYTTSSYSISTIIVFAVILNFARFFEFKIEYVDGLMFFKRELLDSEKHWWYFMFYFIILSIIFDYTVPFAIMFVANMLIISELRRTKKERSLMTIQQQKEQNTTVMLLVITIFFGFCHFFSMALKIAESFAGGFLTIQSEIAS
uniref:G_PROTEIN_RECEP_F1_2 domain-containing protein n=2 Tax=Caenorhabditis japonica TaxID=281687 RepID=A0A8R1DQ52_CAEJA